MPRHVDPEQAAKNQLVERTRGEMRNTWRQDKHLLDKLFSTDASDPKYQNARRKLYNNRSKRWTGILTKPRSSSSLHAPLTNLMNHILFSYGIRRDERLFLDTHTRYVEGDPPSLLSPGIFLAGVGPEFSSTFATLPRGIYFSGIAIFEVSLDSDSEDLKTARDRLAVHMYQIFNNQESRRFAYGISITQNFLTVFMFDHAGAVASAPLDYHAHADQFCALIAGLAAGNDRIGFDNNLVRVGDYATLRTYEPLESGGETERYYKLMSRIFESSSLVGRGTICWIVSSLEDPEATFVVKDAWIAPADLAGRESEGSLLLHAQSKGIIHGIAQIHHFEEVRRSANASDVDTILRNRCHDCSPDEQNVDRVHTRIVMATHGKTLDRFTTQRELLLAFHDVVSAHRKLYDLAGILHRDISVRNILVNPDGVEGDRGILIDFDHAIRVGDTSPYSAKTRIGTYRYMSRNVVKERGQHTYLDDLESFFWVLCWILVAYERPGVGITELPGVISGWDRPLSGTLKEGIFSDDFALPVSPWFGTALRKLATRLHGFFAWRDNRTLKPLFSMDPAKDYDEFLSHIRQSMAEIETELDPVDTDDIPPSLGDKHPRPHEPSSMISQKRDREVDSDKEWAPRSSPHRNRQQRKRLMFPGIRDLSRRGTTNYGFPDAT